MKLANCIVPHVFGISDISKVQIIISEFVDCNYQIIIKEKKSICIGYAE